MPPPARSTANSNLAPPLASLGSYTAHPHPAYNLNSTNGSTNDTNNNTNDTNNNTNIHAHHGTP